MSMRPVELKSKVKGIVHLVMTHFDEHGDVDVNALRTSLRAVVNALKGEDAVFLVAGSTAEFYAMTEEENKKVIGTAVETVNGEFPVIAGTGRAGTKLTIEMSRYAQDAGADGVLVVNPYYQPVTKEGIYRHFKSVAESIDIGIMIYNNPVASKLWIPPDLLARLSKIENIVADKENTPSAGAYFWMQRAVDPEDLVIICGIGHIMYSFESVYGCPGFVTELANFVPEIAVKIYHAAVSRDFDSLVGLINRVAPYHQFISKCAKKRVAPPTVLSPALPSEELPVYQSVIKQAMSLTGLPGGPVREPMENITAEEREELRVILKQMGVVV
jgi:4-hydroxy-tetrahydrodipicolinate synthase